MNPYLSSRRKRALDVLGAVIGLALASPLLAAAALAIRLEGGGHFIYRQRRVGRDGVPFDLYKLRTMVTGAETMGSGLIVDAGDDRITRVGALLRRTSLDELPNLLNVLRGEMSLVGPRPTVQVQVDRYTERQRQPARRAAGHHGLGPGQRPRLAALARADRARPRLPRHASLRHDLFILAASVRMVLTGHGLYRGETGGWREPPHP